MGKPVSRETLWTGTRDEALERGERILRQQKANVINVDRTGGVILAGMGANFRTTGTTVHFFTQPAPGGFRVVVQAAPTVAWKDMGYSSDFVNRFMQAWMAMGGPRGPFGPGDFVL